MHAKPEETRALEAPAETAIRHVEVYLRNGATMKFAATVDQFRRAIQAAQESRQVFITIGDTAAALRASDVVYLRAVEPSLVD